MKLLKFVALLVVIIIQVGCSNGSEDVCSFKHLNSCQVSLSDFDEIDSDGVAALVFFVSSIYKHEAVNYEFPVSPRQGADWIHVPLGEEYSDGVERILGDYMKSQSRDSMEAIRGNYFSYRSDGVDFKLLLINPNDCDSVWKLFPQLIDPKRSDVCRAYGFWTDGALSW